MWYNIGRWASLLNNPSQSIPALAEAKSEVIEKIGTVAFTNINKVRGKEQAKNEYASLAYHDMSGMLLREELSIIQPKMVVCCGTYYEFAYHVKDFNGPAIAMPHSGARKNTITMLEQLRASL